MSGLEFLRPPLDLLDLPDLLDGDLLASTSSGNAPCGRPRRMPLQRTSPLTETCNIGSKESTDATPLAQ